MEKEKKDYERLRLGQCLRCRAKFWWTGLMKDVPDCSCGRQLTRLDFGGQGTTRHINANRIAKA